VKGWVTEALSEMLAGGGKPAAAPDLSTDKKMEAYVEKLVRDGMETIKAEELSKGEPSPTGEPNTTPVAETQPETTDTWQQKISKFLWGGQ
jgi:hypothetical protein